jgi:hypothetical protein
MFSTEQIGKILSKVILIRVLPIPSMSWNCFGLSAVLIGQNLLPIPPAIITQYVFDAGFNVFVFLE